MHWATVAFAISRASLLNSSQAVPNLTALTQQFHENKVEALMKMLPTLLGVLDGRQDLLHLL